MQEYEWLNTKNGAELILFAEELKEKTTNLPYGQAPAMLGAAMAASIRRKAATLNISPEEAVEYYFKRMTEKDSKKKK
jgi:hypothetical protein